MEQPKILVGIPTTGLLDVSFVKALLPLVGDPRLYPQFEVSALVHESRGKLAVDAVVNRYDYLLFIDSDMIFNVDDIDRLLSHGKDIVGANYLKRTWPYVPTAQVHYNIEHPEDGEQLNADIPGLYEVDMIATGFLLIKTVALGTIILDSQVNPFLPLNGLGEDWSFCVRARSAGYSIWADNDLDIGHLGQVVVTRETAARISQASFVTTVNSLFKGTLT